MRLESDSYKEVWKQALAKLAGALSAESLDTWLRPLQPGIVNGALVLYAPNEFVRSEVLSYYADQIGRALPSSLEWHVVVGTAPRERSNVEEVPPASRKSAPGTALPGDGDEASSSVSGQDKPRKERGPKPAINPEPGALPAIWSDAHRALPSEFFRCALFTINRFGASIARPKRERLLIFSQKNFAMYVSGEETNIQDQEVLMQLLHYQRKFKLGRRFSFSARQVLEDMGRPTSGPDIANLIASIERLHETHVRLEKREGADSQVYGFNLIGEFARDGTATQSWTVAFNEVVGELMGPQSHTRVLKSQRDQLSGKNLALWLHGNMSSHANPFPATTEYLYKITGSNVSTLKRFRQKVREALDELVEIGFLQDWTFDADADKFSVRRVPTPIERQ